jgi:hypothetical protein
MLDDNELKLEKQINKLTHIEKVMFALDILKKHTTLNEDLKKSTIQLIEDYLSSTKATNLPPITNEVIKEYYTLCYRSNEFVIGYAVKTLIKKERATDYVRACVTYSDIPDNVKGELIEKWNNNARD